MAELKQPAPVGPTGSSPLSRESKETIIHMCYNLDMDMDARVPLIPSPRGRVHCQKRTVENVIRGFESGPQSTERKARADKTPEADKRALIAIVTDEPQLFLSEIAEELRY